MGEEQRISERYTFSIPVMYAKLTQSGVGTYSYQHSSTFDLSNTGLGMVINEKLENGDLVQVVLMLPISPFVVTGLAQAVWVQQIDETGEYHAGLRFVQTPPELQAALAEHAKSFSSSST